jgi:hypothetical protein
MGPRKSNWNLFFNKEWKGQKQRCLQVANLKALWANCWQERLQRNIPSLERLVKNNILSVDINPPQNILQMKKKYSRDKIAFDWY